jgi:RNA polymerase sigma-70 factor, ECF subfamily
MGDKDNELIEEYLKGNQEAFKIIVEKYTPSIYNFSVRFVGFDYAKDVVQDVFFKVWKNIKKFDKKKANFKTWTFTIARNVVIDYLRKNKPILFSSLDREDETFEENIEDTDILQDEILMKLEDKKLLNNIIDKLPSHYKEVLILYYREDMTFNEIGQLLKKPLNTVKSYHYRALIKLKEMVAPKL